jgi:2-polyprenyl-3-methyl-5-hydroxy-6-metoxy-1,4-benzoquinol methylase
MGRLADKTYWDGIYRSRSEASGPAPGTQQQRESGHGLFRSYSDWLLWDVILPKYLPRRAGARVLEVGSAPGNNLVRLHRLFGYVPYGVDYSDTGVAVNRQVFAQQGLPAENVIHADFLSEPFHAQYRGFFDVVMSAGFIEHFDDPRAVVNRHWDLLAPGGYLVISIPNLGGFNRTLQGTFDRRLLAIHNLQIMSKGTFAALFEREGLAPLFCDYLGTLNFGLFVAPKWSAPWFLLSSCKALQVLMNPILRVLFGRRGCESPALSPYLIFIGIKTTRGG